MKTEATHVINRLQYVIKHKEIIMLYVIAVDLFHKDFRLSSENNTLNHCIKI